MNVEGVWKIEMMGLYGWESISTAFLQDGRYLSASADHYSIGHYAVDGKIFAGQALVAQHGEIRAVFGSKNKQFSIAIKGKVKKGGTIIGTISPTDGKQYEVNVRLSRLGNLD